METTNTVEWLKWRALLKDQRVRDVREVEEDFEIGQPSKGRRLSLSLLYRGHLGTSDTAVNMQYSPTNGAGTWRVSIDHVVSRHTIDVVPFDVLTHTRDSLRAAMLAWLAAQPS